RSIISRDCWRNATVGRARSNCSADRSTKVTSTSSCSSATRGSIRCAASGNSPRASRARTRGGSTRAMPSSVPAATSSSRARSRYHDFMFRWLTVLVVLALPAFGILYVAAGRSAPPRLTIDKPDRFVGQAGSVDVTAGAPNARLTALAITLEQNGRSFPLYKIDEVRLKADATYAANQTTTVTKIDRDHIRISQPL